MVHKVVALGLIGLRALGLWIVGSRVYRAEGLQVV